MMAAQRSARRPAGGNSDVYAHSEKMLRVHRKNHVHACTLRQTVDAYERECNRRLHRIQQEMHEILYYEQLPREREIARARLGGTHAARARDALPSVRYITRLPRLAKPQKSHSEDAETVTTSRRDGELDAPVTAIKNLRLQTERDAFLQKVLFGESRTSLDQTKNCDDVTDVKVKGSSDVTACEQHADEPTVQKTLDRDATMTSPGFKFLRNKIINDEFSDTSDVISSRGSPACHNGNDGSLHCASPDPLVVPVLTSSTGARRRVDDDVHSDPGCPGEKEVKITSLFQLLQQLKLKNVKNDGATDADAEDARQEEEASKKKKRRKKVSQKKTRKK